jgi:hypothetical protein
MKSIHHIYHHILSSWLESQVAFLITMDTSHCHHGYQCCHRYHMMLPWIPVNVTMDTSYCYHGHQCCHIYQLLLPWIPVNVTMNKTVAKDTSHNRHGYHLLLPGRLFKCPIKQLNDNGFKFSCLNIPMDSFTATDVTMVHFLSPWLL